MGLKLSRKKEEVKEEPAPEKVEIPVDESGEDKDTVWIDEVMVRKQSFDLTPVNQMFAKVHKYVDDMAKQADEHKVIDVVSMEKAIGMGTQAKQYINKIEKTRVEVKAPYLAFGKKLDQLAKGVQSRLEAIQESLRQKIRPIMIAEKEKENERLRAEEERRKASAGEQQELTPGFATAEVPAPIAPPAPAVSGPIKTASGSAGLEKKYTWTVSDITKVPSEYLTVIASKVNKAVKAGEKIPGLKIEVTDEVKMVANKS